MHNNSLISMALVASALAVTSVPVSAGALTYSDPSAFAGAVSVTGTLTFEELLPGTHISPLVDLPLVFTALASGFGNVTVGTSFGPGSGQFVMATDSFEVSPVSPGAIYAFGLYLGCYACDAGNPNATVVVTDTSSNTYTYSVPTMNNFWGVSSTIAIASLSFTLPSYGNVSIDDVSYGSLSSGAPGGDGDTPEAATLILIGSGLAVIARFRKYGNQNSATA